MKRFNLALLILSTVFARYDIAVGDTTWTYDQSTFQSFYMFEAIEVNALNDSVVIWQDVDETDVIGAKKLGMKTVFAKYGDTFETCQSGADHDINDIKEIISILNNINKN